MRTVSTFVVLGIFYLLFITTVANRFGATTVESTQIPQVAGVSTTRNAFVDNNPENLPLVDKINHIRRSYGLLEVTYIQELQEITDSRTNDMVTNQYYAHINLAGLDFSSLFDTYPNFSCENLDMTNTENVDVITQDWMNSTTGHRECLLSPRANQIGVTTKLFAEESEQSRFYVTTLVLSSDQ
jgi:uncharacterized protein YkwD